MPSLSLSKSHPQIAARWHPVRNGDLTPEQVTAGSGRKVWWLCPEFCSGGCPHEWEATVTSQIKATGCPHCLPRSHHVCVHRSIVTTHPDVAAQWHPTRNGDMTPDRVLAGSTKKYWWRCPVTCPEGCQHEWETFVANRCKGQYGCPFCSRLTKQVCIHTSIVGTYPAEAAQWHPTKNGDLRPENFSYGSEKVVWWLCPKTSCEEGCPHEWATEIAKRMKRGIDTGCPFCASNHKSVCIHNSIVTTHPHLLTEWDYEKNEGLLPEKLIAGSAQRVWWKCPKTCSYGCEHRWEARINDRVRGETGCPYCCIQRQKFCIHQTITYTHPHLVEEWHPKKNGDMKPDKCVSGSGRRIWWRCTINPGHEWSTAINIRVSNKTGCPHCRNNKTEGMLFVYLKKHFPDTVHQYTIENCKRVKYLPFDFCIPSLNVIIEMDGGQHFKQVMGWMSSEETMRRDIFKMRKAETDGYKVIRITQEDVFWKGEEWLDEYLLPEIRSENRDSVFIATKTDLYAKHLELYSGGDVIELV